jgi:hypothetical protein
MGEFYIAMSDYRKIDFFNVEPDCSGAFRNLIKIVGNDFSSGLGTPFPIPPEILATRQPDCPATCSTQIPSACR